MEKTIEEIAEMATKWWTDVLSDTSSHLDNCDFSEKGLMAKTLYLKLSRSVVISDEEKDKFSKMLYNHIIDKCNQYGDCTLITDYEPQFDLRRIAGASNIIFAKFPWKIDMYICEGCIIIGTDGLNDLEIIYATEDYCRDKIKEISNEISAYIDIINSNKDKYNNINFSFDSIMVLKGFNLKMSVYINWLEKLCNEKGEQL